MFYGVYNQSMSNLWEWIYSTEKSGWKGNLLYAWMPFSSSGKGKNRERNLSNVCINLFYFIVIYNIFTFFFQLFLTNFYFFLTVFSSFYSFVSISNEISWKSGWIQSTNFLKTNIIFRYSISLFQYNFFTQWLFIQHFFYLKNITDFYKESL